MLYLTQIITLDTSPKYSCPFFASPYGYLGQLVLLYIFVNLFCLLVLYYVIMLGINKVVVVLHRKGRVLHSLSFELSMSVIFLSSSLASSVREYFKQTETVEHANFIYMLRSIPLHLSMNLG